MVTPLIVPPVSAAWVIMTFDPAHLGSAVRTTHAVPRPVEPGAAAFARLRWRCRRQADDRRGPKPKSYQTFHLTSPLLSSSQRGGKKRCSMNSGSQSPVSCRLGDNITDGHR